MSNLLTILTNNLARATEPELRAKLQAAIDPLEPRHKRAAASGKNVIKVLRAKQVDVVLGLGTDAEFVVHPATIKRGGN